MSDTRKRVETIAARYERKLGHRGASTGRLTAPLEVIPTGILALDYALGIGGWPKAHMVEVFGPPDVGKSSIIGFNAIREAQALGMVCGLVALEPGFDPAWAEKNGVDLDQLVIGWPNDGQEAFELAFDFVCDDDIDFVLFDSIGALLRPSEAEDDGKPSQGGQSALITWGVKRLLMPTWKRNKSIIFLNQIRDKMGFGTFGFDSPGGHALKHSCSVRVQLKAGRERYTTKIEGEDVMVGRQVVAQIMRNKLTEGTGKKAVFDHYAMDVDDQPFGIDRASDVLNIGVRTGIIAKNGTWYHHSLFPGGKLQKGAVGEFLLDTSTSYATIRNEVLIHMRKPIVKGP